MCIKFVPLPLRVNVRAVMSSPLYMCVLVFDLQSRVEGQGKHPKTQWQQNLTVDSELTRPGKEPTCEQTRPGKVPIPPQLEHIDTSRLAAPTFADGAAVTSKQEDPHRMAIHPGRAITVEDP